jgi:predicted Fe-S protein YdhL (DUF1289 family)
MANETDDSQPHPAAAPDSDRARRRAARRAALGRKIDTSVPSPCIAVCQIDDASGQCLGCHRTIDEIRDWSRSGDAAKLLVWQAIEARQGL